LLKVIFLGQELKILQELHARSHVQAVYFQPPRNSTWRFRFFILRYLKVRRLVRPFLMMNKNKKRFDILKAVADIEIPSLFVHGEADTSVPPSESEELLENCSAYSKRLELIEGANHTFGIKHPFETDTPEYDTACTLTEHWFDNNLMM